MRLSKVFAFLIIFSTLLQPLGLVSPVFADTVEMEYTDPDHINAPKIVDGVKYQYDANGNLVSDGERLISWNQDNLPTRIEKDGKITEFFYDANGQRIVKQSGEDKTVYVNSSYQQLTINNQQSVSKYYFANGRRVATTRQQGGQGQALQLHSDHLGSTILATDSNSQPTSDPLSYFPYGRSINNQQLAISNYLFTGQEEDPEINLYNYNARLYNPTTGVFISADSVGGGNRYSYAANNPIMFTDPTGHMLDAGGGGGGLGDGLEITISGDSNPAPGITATTPINTTNTTNPSPDDWFLTEQEYRQWIAFMSDFGAITMGITTAVIYAPALIAYLAFTKDYIYYNYFYSAPSAPASASQIVGSADSSLVGWNWELREPGCRTGACGLGSNLVRFEAEAAGATARMYQVRDINMALGVPAESTFQHGFTVVETGGEEFLVDLTFSQFMDPVSGIIRQNPHVTGVSIADPFAQQLLTQGYVPLTQENFVRYLQLTTSAGADVSSATLDMLGSVGILPWDYSVAELNRLTGR